MSRIAREDVIVRNKGLGLFVARIIRSVIHTVRATKGVLRESEKE